MNNDLEYRKFKRVEKFTYIMLALGFVTFGITAFIGMFIAHNKEILSKNTPFAQDYQRTIVICWLIFIIALFPFILVITGMIIPAYMELHPELYYNIFK